MIQNISNNERVERYRKSADNVREYYIGEDLIRNTDLLIEKFLITQPYQIISEIIGDTLLGFFKLEQLSELFVERLGISLETAHEIAEDAEKFIAPVLSAQEQDAQNKKTDLQRLAEQFAQKGARASSSEKAPTETSHVVTQEIEKIQPLRTMEGDINRIHGYGAYNEMLERGTEADVHTSDQDDMLKR
jgi:hypothetical protein